MRKRAIPFVVTMAALLGAASPSFAQGMGLGVRAGASVNPDQFYVGAHVDTPAIVSRVHLRPNLEIGFGDDVTLVAVNIEAVYNFPLRQSPWTAYGGGGPAINYYNFDEDRDSDTRGGLNFVGGLQHDNGLFFEVKVGAWDSPDLKFGVGYVFGR